MAIHFAGIVSDPADLHKLAWPLLETRAVSHRHQDFLRFRDARLEYGAFADRARALAQRLHTLGIRRGDIVPGFFDNGATMVLMWFALMRLGAVWAPVNTEFRGEQLLAALRTMRAARIVAQARFVDLLQPLLPELEGLTCLVVADAGQHRPALSGDIACVALEAGITDVSAPLPDALVSHDDIAMIQFTSGSTGVSKAVQLSHGYLVGQAALMADGFGLREEDVIYCPFPLYHWDASVGTVMAALVRGATAAIAGRFSASGFWEDIRAFDATVFDFMGATLSFLSLRPPSADDRRHRVRMAWGMPMPEFREDFEARFGVRLLEGYGSTEGGISVFQSLGEHYPPGSCGRVSAAFSLKILDDAGCEVAPGQTGEITLKPTDDPELIMRGYLNMPEVNAALIRDGRYHTGDLGHVDAEGHLFFDGRIKDVIRRRGENISAFEIERELMAHPDVLDAAAFGVPSRHTEEDVAVAIVLRPGTSCDAEAIRAHCAGRMARYMCPEHVWFVQHLPRTGTGKIAKPLLREQLLRNV